MTTDTGTGQSSAAGAAATLPIDELAWLPAWRLAERIAGGELSAEEATRAALERIAAHDPVLHAFLTVAGDTALAEARAADAAVMAGHPPGPLHGVPIALKDEIWTRGIRSTGGSLIYENFLPTRDAAVVERLRAAGAIIVGKTQLPEFAMWPRSFNRVGPEACNPYDPTRISGASSGGSAVAVAAGMTPLAVGSDGGGSVRIPAALCAVVGLHPTPGSVPDQGTFSYSPHASLGPITRDTRDAALLWQVIAGLRPDVAGFDSGVRGMRIAWTPDYGWIQADPQVVAAAKTTMERLVDAGAIVEEPSIQIADIWPAFAVFTVGSARYQVGLATPYVQSQENLARCLREPERLMPGVAELLATPLPSREAYQEAAARVQQVADQLRGLFARYDVICSPTLPFVAPPIPDGWQTPYPDERMGTCYTSVVNVTRGTAASVPCGLVDGMPAGLHIMAPGGKEDVVLTVCRALERLQPWTARPPLQYGQ